jgi:transcriptional regulator with XRE-family HTH domain
MRINAERLRYEAAIRGLDQRELAHRARISEATVCRILQGRSARPMTARRIADALTTVSAIPELLALVPTPYIQAASASDSTQLKG